jgi:hypothetical protein
MQSNLRELRYIEKGKEKNIGDNGEGRKRHYLQ